MKYLTKSWYLLMSKVGMIDLFTEIADQEYTDEMIEKMIEDKFNQDVKQQEELYNSPPDFSFFDEFANQEFDPDDYLILYDDKTSRRPANKEELLEQIELDKKQVLEEYNNRAPFDSQEARRIVEEGYQNSLRHLETRDEYPDWLYDFVDKRLLALGLLPKSIYERLEKESNQIGKEFNETEKEAYKELMRNNIPTDISLLLLNNDASVLDFQSNQEGICLTLNNTENDFQEDNGKVKILFKNGKIIEQDFPIQPKIEIIDDIEYSDIIYLAQEIYRIEKGYQVHLLLKNDYGLGYLTIECEDVIRM